jgi:hypothetical protein
VLRDIGGHSGTSVADSQPHVAAFLRVGPSGDGAVVHRDIAGIDGQRAASLHRVTGVNDEIHQHLL